MDVLLVNPCLGSHCKLKQDGVCLSFKSYLLKADQNRTKELRKHFQEVKKHFTERSRIYQQRDGFVSAQRGFS